MKEILKYLLPAIAFFLLTVSCVEKVDYPLVPDLEYNNFVKIDNGLGYDDKGILYLGFTDGDGNIGLADGDTFPPFDPQSMYYYNFFVRYFEQQNGTFVEVELPFANNARIPVLSENENPLKGEIALELFINNFTSAFDTVRFEAFITDRDLNHSDTVSTPPIIIQKP